MILHPSHQRFPLNGSDSAVLINSVNFNFVTYTGEVDHVFQWQNIEKDPGRLVDFILMLWSTGPPIEPIRLTIEIRYCNYIKVYILHGSMAA